MELLRYCSNSNLAGISSATKKGVERLVFKDSVTPSKDESFSLSETKSIISSKQSPIFKIPSSIGSSEWNFDKASSKQSPEACSMSSGGFSLSNLTSSTTNQSSAQKEPLYDTKNLAFLKGAYLYRNIPIILGSLENTLIPTRNLATIEASDPRPTLRYAMFSELTQEQKNLDLIAKMNSFLAKLEIEVLQKCIEKKVLFGQGVQLSES